MLNSSPINAVNLDRLFPASIFNCLEKHLSDSL
jgi:hypothetical protein